MERLTVVDDTKKTDAIEERNFKSCTASRNIHQDHHPRARTGQNKPKYHLKLQEHQDDQPTFPQNE